MFSIFIDEVSEDKLGHGSHKYHELVSVNNRNHPPREASF